MRKERTKKVAEVYFTEEMGRHVYIFETTKDPKVNVVKYITAAKRGLSIPKR